jgi:hypothetical protein
VLTTAFVCCVAVLAALCSLVVPPGARPTPDRTTPAEAKEGPPPDKGQPRVSGARTAAGQPAGAKERPERQASAEATTGGEPDPGPSTPTLRPMPTVTVKIDTLTGLLATKDCPNASTMTYPAGDEPRQYCTAHHKTRVQPEPPRSDGSRLKSIGKGVAKPLQWLGGGGN